MSHLRYESVRPGVQQSDLPTVAQYMFTLMMRNISSDGYVFTDPLAKGVLSIPGCVIASPSYPADLTTVDQDYVMNWTRDAAIAAVELAEANLPAGDGRGVQALIDYVNFADACQSSGAPTIGHACFTIEGQPRPWSEQSDGPALQTLAILRAFPQLDSAAQETARKVIGRNSNYLMGIYQSPTRNLWEERDGYSFFARSVQLRCFEELMCNAHDIAVPNSLANAISWLEGAVQAHWNGTYYVTILPPQSPGDPSPAAPPLPQDYDPNIDIVMASIYGAIPYTDTRLLATAAQLRRQWEDPSSPFVFPINVADYNRGIGPMLGRYPGDSYDGDTRDPVPGGHPWPVCTANFAELYYGLAATIIKTHAIPLDDLSKDFFGLIGIDGTTQWHDAVLYLQGAGDKMLQAIISHSDHLELSEQFDGSDGYEKSVRDLTWSYAAFLSAVRSRNWSARAADRRLMPNGSVSHA